MRNLLFKNMTSDDHKKRDVFVQETVTKCGIMAFSERRCLYFIKDRLRIDNPADLVRLAEIKQKNKDAMRSFYIFREHDSKAGLDKLVCRLRGTFFAVVGKTIFSISFIHSLKITFEPAVTS